MPSFVRGTLGLQLLVQGGVPYLVNANGCPGKDIPSVPQHLLRDNNLPDRLPEFVLPLFHPFRFPRTLEPHLMPGWH